jgi:hypothetical protein
MIDLLKLNFPNLKIKFTLKENTKGVVWARNKIREELYQNEEYFLQVDSHSRFKKNWDAILINQYNSINQPKVIISTYPNHFDVPDYDKKYLNLPFNTPLKIKDRIHQNNPLDNRYRAENLPSLNDYEVKETRWIAAGFLFTRVEWTQEVKLPDNIVYNGEEDYQTFLSYLKGWNIYVPSEATIWHNYNFKTSDTDTPYREHNTGYFIEDKASELINTMLFNNTYERSIEQLEEYFNIELQKIPSTIFISLASFIDTDLRNTILSCINQAKHPENITFGVVLQYNNEADTNETCIDDLITKYNIRIKKFWFKESQGGCWARNQVSSLYQNEDYVLQLDAHIRMVKNWDVLLIKEYLKLKQNHTKPLISYLSPPFFRNENLGLDYDFKHIDNPYIINVPTIKSITDGYWPIFGGYEDEAYTYKTPNNVSLLYAGFVFTQGNWILEVKNDPEHYYTGEEFALSIRSYTHGYDIFIPSQIMSWHLSRPNHIHHFKVLDGDANHNKAMERLYKLIFGGDLGEYGLGNKRTLQQYEEFAKINIKEKKV